MPLTPFGRFAWFVRFLLPGIAVAGCGLRAVAETPRLAIVISIDQFRYDYLDRFAPYFGEGGFKRLRTGGLNFEDCRYRHAVTKTAPGHATILSGVHADVHGIVANDWIDRTSWQMVESVEDPTVAIIGAAPKPTRSPGGVLEAKAGRSPRNFFATTVGDQLKLRFGSNSRIFSVAHKDRAAILMGGKLADSAYWIADGRLVTSTYYRDRLPAWVEAFNAEGRVEKFFGKTWDRLLPAAVYDAVQGPDDFVGENTDFGFGRTMPKTIDGGEKQLTPKFYEAFETTPAASELIGQFAQLALQQEQLGRHQQTDMLCVGFSQIDKLGHAYGPDSHEIMDSIIRLDRVIASLLDAVDREVGLANCVVVLTADHGSSPLPERVHALRPGIEAGRLDAAALDQAVTSALEKAFGPAPAGDYWFMRDNFGYHFRQTVLQAFKINADDAARVAKQVLLARPEIATAFTAAEVLAMPAEDDSLTAQSRRSFFPGRSQDVVFVLKPYYVVRANTGTDHGTPYDYDNHVPMLWFGAGVPAGRRSDRVGMDDLAPTLAGLLGVPPPPQAKGHHLF